MWQGTLLFHTNPLTYDTGMNNDIVTTIREYFKTKPIEKAWIFGSFSRGEETAESDVDILVTLVPGTRMGLSWFGMICDLEKLTGRSVDLVMDGDLLPFATESANRDKILVYERAA